MKRKILVTGGAGYIGSHTAVELLNEGFDVIIIDDLSNAEESVIERIEKISGKKVTFFKFDLCDKEKVANFFKQNNDVDSLIHFAAFKSVGESVVKPLEYYKNNINSVINLLEAGKDTGLKNFIFSSSCTVYGQPDKMPVTEQTPRKEAECPYGNTKRFCEDILADYTHANKTMNAIALRYFNPVGAHPSALIGESPKAAPNNLMPYITQTGAGIREQLTVFGNDYDTPDGTCVRDFIHVVDLAKAHVLALMRMLDNKMKSGYEIFNLGTGNGFSVLDVIKSFEKTSGMKLNYKIGERRAGDIEKIWADASYAKTELDWEAKLSLDEMTKSAWDWQLKIVN